jgi:hypothetical protein
MPTLRKAIFGATLLLALSTGFIRYRAFAQKPKDYLEQGFKSPPNSAKPRVWWHWMNGNTTKEGIKLDLEFRGTENLSGPRYCL